MSKSTVKSGKKLTIHHSSHCPTFCLTLPCLFIYFCIQQYPPLAVLHTIQLLISCADIIMQAEAHLCSSILERSFSMPSLIELTSSLAWRVIGYRNSFRWTYCPPLSSQSVLNQSQSHTLGLLNTSSHTLLILYPTP